MKSVLKGSILALMLVLFISSLSFADLNKGRVGPGGQRIFVLTTPVGGVSIISLIYDTGATDLDILVGPDDGSGDILGASISPESFFEVLQIGLTGNEDFLIGVDHFEGPASSFRLVVNSSQQQNVRAGNGGAVLREIEMTPGAKKLFENGRKLRNKLKPR